MTRGLALVVVGLLAVLAVPASAPRTVPVKAEPAQRVVFGGAALAPRVVPTAAASAPRAVPVMAASAERGPVVGAELIPAMPWPTPVATVVWAQPDAANIIDRSPFLQMEAPAAQPPDHVADTTPLETREHPATEVVGSRWYEPERTTPDRLYLERLLAREVVEGWNFDAGYNGDGFADWREVSDVESLSFGFDGRMQRTTTKNADGDYIEAAMVGPSMRWQPTDRTRLELSQMVGVGSPYPLSEVCVSYGCKF